MLYIQRKKSTVLKALVMLMATCVSIACFSQRDLNLEEHDYKPYYFGISLGFNRASFHSELNKAYLNQDSISTAEPVWTPGFNLGLSATVRLSSRFEFRFNPQLIFTERDISYALRIRDLDNAEIVQKKVESVITSFPFQLRFLSDRIGNFKVYMLGGIKYDIDLASNAKARKAEDMIRIGGSDFGIEAGFGFKFYYPSFILAPEIKFSNGSGNLHTRSSILNYSSVLDRLQSRMLILTIHLEG